MQFANAVYRTLKERNYSVFPINPNISIFDGDKCYPSVLKLPKQADAAIVLLPPNQTERVLPEILTANIQHVWIGKGADSPQAIRFCEANNLNVIYGECILMFAEPVETIHRFHRWINKMFRKLPT